MPKGSRDVFNTHVIRIVANGAKETTDAEGAARPKAHQTAKRARKRPVTMPISYKQKKTINTKGNIHIQNRTYPGGTGAVRSVGRVTPPDNERERLRSWQSWAQPLRSYVPHPLHS